MATKRKRLRAPSNQSSFTAVLESIRLENRVVAESVTGLRAEMQGMRAEMTRRFDTLEAAVLELGVRVKALEVRVGALEEAVRKNSEDIRKNSEDIQRLREQLAELTGIVRGKAEAKDVAALAERVARLEARVGL